MEHFIEALGCHAKYLAATKFLKQKTAKHNERKECPNEKRMREFAEAAAEKQVEGVEAPPAKKKGKRVPLTPAVSSFAAISFHMFLSDTQSYQYAFLSYHISTDGQGEV